MTTEDVHKLVRLYVPNAALQAGETHALSEEQHHYLRNVMRMEEGHQLRVFNGADGEWLASVQEINKKKAIISIVQQLREQNDGQDVIILSPPVKKEVFDFMVQKACELGAGQLQPVITAHTSVHKINEERLQWIATEAAEQCERLTVMPVLPLSDLKSVLESWDKNKKLIFCIERSDAPAMIHSLIAEEINPPLGVLIGPEGGFSEEEVAYITGLEFVVPVSLGPNVLRTETAMISALLCLQAVGGIRAKMAAQKS